MAGQIPRRSTSPGRISIVPLSAMPKGLLNTLSKEEILDLLAYIEAGGNARR
jgi:hypothetical protein